MLSKDDKFIFVKKLRQSSLSFLYACLMFDLKLLKGAFVCKEKLNYLFTTSVIKVGHL